MPAGRAAPIAKTILAHGRVLLKGPKGWFIIVKKSFADIVGKGVAQT